MSCLQCSCFPVRAALGGGPESLEIVLISFVGLDGRMAPSRGCASPLALISLVVPSAVLTVLESVMLRQLSDDIQDKLLGIVVDLSGQNRCIRVWGLFLTVIVY